MPQVRPIEDLRNPEKISQLCHEKQEPVFFTKDGHCNLVVMSVEAYVNLLDTSPIDTAIAKAEKEYADNGTLIDAREAVASLRE